jgi:hypothetical protein
MNATAEEIEEVTEEVEQELEEVETEVEELEAGQPEEEESDDDEVTVSIGEESPPQEDETEHAPEWVRELRKTHRETQRENRELKAKLEAMNAPAARVSDPGKKPTLDDYDYDAEAYESGLTEWFDRKRQYDAELEQAEAERQAQEQAWHSTLNAYAEKRKELKVRDYDDAEALVQESLSNTQQGMILQGADNPALVVYALGKNPAKAKEISSIKDPVKFAFAVAKLETQLKVGKRKAATRPEKTVSGGARSVGTADSNLSKLREEAARTGDFSKVTAYRRKMKRN